jgi:hypothetical protein
MSGHPPGWHPDPNLPAGTLRWWDGSRWTEHLHHPSPEPRSAEAVAGPASAASHFAAYDAPAGATGFNQFASASQPTVGAAVALTFTQRNPTTLTAIFVVALYLALAATTGIVLIGIFPAMLAFRAFQRREPLAALAVAAAAVAIVFSMTVLTRH